MRLSESAPGFGRVQRNRGAHEARQRFAVDGVAFAEVDRAPRVPSRLELNSPAGSSSDAPFANVIFTTLLYVSPVQMIPSCSQTGTPRHFHSSTPSGSASLTRP